MAALPKINILTESSWICRKLANHLAYLPGFDIEVSTEPKRYANLTYYLPYLTREFYHPPNANTVALFTHYIPGKHQARYDRIARLVKHAVVLNAQHQSYLEHLVGKDKVTRISLPVDRDLPAPKLRVGWFHRNPAGYDGRKRADLLKCIEQLEWVELVTSNGSMDRTSVVAEMQRCDVVLTTSDYESGPVSLLEALALGKQVVIPQGVGLADEYATVPGVYLFPRGDGDGLVEVLRRIYAPIKSRLEAVQTNTVESWQHRHRDLFSRLLK